MNRLFLAIEPNSLIRRNLSEVKPKLEERLDRQGLRWIPIHKYVIRLAEIGDEEIEATVAKLEGVAQKAPSITIGRIGGMPDTKRPAELHFEASDSTKVLTKLREKILEALGTEDEEEFQARLIVAKMKPASSKLGHKLRDYMHSGVHPENATWTAEELILFNTTIEGNLERVHAWPFK